MSYFEWFIKKGWRQYAAPFLLGVVILAADIYSIDSIINAPIAVQILAILSAPGFCIGIAIHSWINYKANK